MQTKTLALDFHSTKNFVIKLMITAVLAFGFMSAVKADDSENIKLAKALSSALADVSERVSPAVVHVKTEQEIETTSSRLPKGQEEIFKRFFGPDVFGQRDPFEMPKSYKRKSQGSGFIIDANGTVITNNHVVENAKKVEVVLPDKRIFQAEIVGTDPKSDIAVLKLKDTNKQSIPHLKLGDSEKLRIGEMVIAIGAPFGLSKTVTTGIVSAIGRDVGMAAYENYIQTDAAINPGNSGGPLFNLDGEVIGINTAISSASGGNNGVGFAIPIDMAKRIVDQLVNKGEVVRGWIGVGIQDIEPEMATMFKGYDGKGGVIITQVGPGMPADKAGIKAGDVILELSGKRIQDTHELRYMVANAPVGKKLKVKVLRKGKEVSLNLIPEKQPEQLSLKAGSSSTSPENAEDASNVTKDLGIEVQELTDTMAEKFGYETLTGVLVSAVKPGSYAADKGIRPGTLIVEVEHKPITNIESFVAAMKETKDKDRVLFRIISGDAARYIVLKKEEESKE